MRTFKDFIVEVEYRQGKLLTKKGTAQNFTNPKRVPFTSTDPVSSSASKPSSTPKPVAKPSPGQMNIPGLSGKSKSGAQGSKPTGSTTSRGGAKITTPKSTGGPIGTRNVPNIKQVSAKYGKDAPAPKPSWKGKGAQTASSGSRVSVTGRPDAGAQAARVMRGKTPTTTGTGASLSRGLSAIKNVGRATATGAAQSLGISLAGKLAQTMGKPGQPRMSKFGSSLRGDAPVYNTPWSRNNVKPTPTATTKPTSTAKPTPTPTSTAATKPTPAAPKMTARQKADVKTRATYDKLRASNPELAKKYGMAASKSRFK